MITEKITITKSGSGMDEALSTTENAADKMSLTSREKLRLRLLAEEMMSMVRSVTGDLTATFWLEAEGKTFTLHIEAKSELSYSKRRELLSASTTGKNAANLGIMDKIRGIIEAGIYGLEEGFELQAKYGTGMFSYGAMGLEDFGMSEAVYAWSMQKYRNDLEAGRNDNPDEWDELEKSIIANIADDVSVGILRDKAVLTVTKKF